MKEVLVINLKRNGDIFSMGHLVRSILANDNETKINLVVLKEFERAARCLNGVENIYTIDREKLLTFKKNRIFSDGYALNQFQNDLAPLMLKSWDSVYNYSNDRVSTHLTSLLKSKSTKHIGIRFNNTCNIEYSNEWAIVFNDILTSVKYAPISFNDTYHKMMSLKSDKTSFILRTNKEYNETAYSNFSEIRSLQEGTKDIKIVGIQIFTSSETKNLVHDELIKLIDKFYMSTQYIPVLLVAPTETERRAAKIINSEFNNSLISVEADFTALTSVLMNLDLLITPDTAIKHQADLCDTPTIEISLGESPLFKQGTTNLDSLIITPKVNARSFSKATVEATPALQAQNELIDANDILKLANYLMNGESITEDFSPGVTVYRPVEDKLGINLVHFQGEIDNEAEIERLLTRQYLSKKLLGEEDTTIYDQLKSYDLEFLSDWVTGCKDNVTHISKSLLGTLRSLLQMEKDPKQTGLFIHNLTELCSFCELQSQFMKTPILRFRARLEAINSNAITQSAREVEGLLYELKADIQHQVEIIKTTQDVARKERESQRVQRSNRGLSNEHR